MRHDLILYFLKAISQNQDIYPLLVEHLDKLDHNFASELRKFASQTFVKQPTKAVSLAKIIVKFSNLIKQFQQGNSVNNLEIAIAGYESAVTVITHEYSLQEWSAIQKALVSVYQQRQDILSKTIEELKENTVQNQIQINNLTKQFEEEKQQSCELKAQLMKVMEFHKQPTPAIDLQPIVSAIKEIKLPSPSFNTVIFYDIENLTEGNYNPKFNFSLEDIIQKIKRHNLVKQIAGQYAYADWSDNRLKKIKPNIQQFAIEPMQIFGFNHHKNAADIQLVIDAVELIHTKPSLEVFAIVSGDGGFSCLAKKLHEYGKLVIGCAYDNRTNNVFAAVCDYFIRLPASVQQNPDQTNNCTETTAKVEAEAKNMKNNNNNYNFFLEYLKTNEPYETALKQNGIDFSDVNKVLKEQISDFDYKKLGFGQFKKFLASIIQDTEFKIVYHDKNKARPMLKIN